MSELLIDATQGKRYKSKREEIMTYIKDTSRFDRNTFCYDNWVINFSNGYYDIKKDEFISHNDSDKVFCYEIPHEFKSPAVLKYDH